MSASVKAPTVLHKNSGEVAAHKNSRKGETNMCKFRNLVADEIDVRVSQVQDNGFTLLLYKDARCDMAILDETVGAKNWQRIHTRENANCIVSIWDEDKKQWISKEDTGTESNTEKEKGLASDSFKRACVNWGIGRELYTSPFIWVSDTSYIKLNKKTGKNAVYERFKVSTINISDKKVITGLEIVDSKGKLVFSTKSKQNKPIVKLITADQINRLIDLGADIDKFFQYCGVDSIDDVTYEQAEKAINKKEAEINRKSKRSK